MGTLRCEAMQLLRRVRVGMNLAVILGFRDWHVHHLVNCLWSLSLGRLCEVPVIVVDFGCTEYYAKAVKMITSEFNMTLVRVEAPGWSRARALNIGARAAQEWPGVETFVFTDADMLFPPSWAPTVAKQLPVPGLLLTHSRDLPEAYITGDRIARSDRLANEWWLLAQTTPHPDVGQGAAMVVPRRWFEYVRGFDETYSIWAAEDNDLVLRAQWSGLPVTWLDGTFVVHQEHPRDWATPAQLEQVRRNREYLRARMAEQGPVVRNPEGWGGQSRRPEEL
mgnify:FL=1